MRLFVTGGAGFIGSNYVRWLLEHRDDEIVAFDVLSYAGCLENLNGLIDDPRLDFVEGDVCDRAALASAMAGCDAVLHFAAETHVDRSIVAPDAFVASNCGGTNVVCDVARCQQVERFLHVSSDEVYGSVSQGSSSEDDSLAPRSLYAASKAGSDLIALSYHSTHGLPVLVTRSSNNFGPWQFPEKIVPLFVTNLLDGAGVPLYGDGRNVRDWCPVADNCSAIDLVLRAGAVGEIYNIAAGNELSNRELTERLIELCGRDESAINYVADRLGHDRRYSLDCSKLRALGWAPQQGFSEALAGTVDWYRANRWWWEPRKYRSGSNSGRSDSNHPGRPHQDRS